MHELFSLPFRGPAVVGGAKHHLRFESHLAERRKEEEEDNERRV